MSEGLATSLPTDLKCQESRGSPEAQGDQLCHGWHRTNGSAEAHTLTRSPPATQQALCPDTSAPGSQGMRRVRWVKEMQRGQGVSYELQRNT